MAVTGRSAAAQCGHRLRSFHNRRFGGGISRRECSPESFRWRWHERREGERIRLPLDDEIGTAAKILGSMIGGVGTVHDDSRAMGQGDFGHFPGEHAHARETHFGEEVEIVFVDGDDTGLVNLQGIAQPRLRLCEHGIEDGYGNAVLAEQAGGVERAEGWIGLHFARLLAIVGEVIGVREEDISHGTLARENRTVKRSASACGAFGCRFEALSINGGLEERRFAFQAIVDPKLYWKGISVVIKTPARGERKYLLSDASVALARVEGDGDTIEGDAKIVAHDLEALVFAAIEPREHGVAGEEIGPAFERGWNLNTELLSLFHDGGAGVGSEDIGPEFGSRKTAADVHHEIDGFAAFCFPFTRVGKDDVERRSNAGLQAARGAFVDGIEILEGFVHGLQDFFRA